MRAHWGAIAAADFFSVEVLTVGGLVRYFVFFVIDLKTRRVHVAGVSNSPDGAWMAQVARNLTDAESGFLKDARHLIVDRDPLYTAHFKEILASAKVKLLRLPARSPNLKAYASYCTPFVRCDATLLRTPFFRLCLTGASSPGAS